MEIKPPSTSAMDQIAKVFNALGSAIGRVATAISSFSFTGSSIGGNDKPASLIKDISASASIPTPTQRLEFATIFVQLGYEHSENLLKSAYDDITKDSPELLNDPKVKELLAEPGIKEIIDNHLKGKMENARQIVWPEKDN